MKTEDQGLSNPKLKKLEKDLVKVEKAKDYLDAEREKLVKERKIIRGKIKKEKEVLRLKRQIERVKGRKK